MFKYLKDKWKKWNTGYFYSFDSNNPNDLFDISNWSIFSEYRDPFWDKIYRRFCESWPLEKLSQIKRWFLFRTFSKHHYVWTGFEPGFHDRDVKMEGCVFQCLRDHYEIDRCPEWVKWVSAPYQYHPMWEGVDEKEIKEYHERCQPLYKLYEKVRGKQPWDFETRELTEILVEIILLRGQIWN